MNGLLTNNLKSPIEIFQQEGVLFYPKVFEGEELARLREAAEYILEQNWRHIDEHEPSKKNSFVMADLINPRWHREHDKYWKLLMETVADSRCLGPVEQIMGGPSLFYTTQLFFNPRFESCEGFWHRDLQSIYKGDEEKLKVKVSCRDDRSSENFGIQFQIALVDNDDIEYVPFSASRYDSPEEYYYRVADNHSHNQEAGMPNAMRIRQRAGDAIIFNPNGIHRGRYYVDNPRRTLMLTYIPPTARRTNVLTAQELGFTSKLSRRARAYFEDCLEMQAKLHLVDDKAA